MGNANKYADGLAYLLFPGNLGFGFASYNFPESTAQDDGGGVGSVSLSFSGSQIPYTNGASVSGWYGPSGFYANYTPLANLSSGIYFDPRGNNYAGKTITFSTVDPNAPNLRSIYNVNESPGIEAGYGTKKDQSAFNSISQINVLDLICEGPVEGFVTGIYIPNFSGKTTGDIGYTSVTFQPFEKTYSVPESRSIYWNDVPITDLQGFYNFQYANYKYTYGEKTNDHTIYNPYLSLYEERRDYFGKEVDKNKIPLQTSTTRSIGESLYGFYYISGNQSIISPKTYYIYNTEISSLKINIKINGLYEQVLTGVNAGDVLRQDLQIRYTVYRILNNGNLVLLDTSKYPPFEKAYWSVDDILILGKISNSPVIFTYEIGLRPYAENKPYFPLFPNQIGWAVDITKMSREFITPSLNSSCTIDSITEVYSDRFVYPDTAMVLSKFDARYFNDVPARSYLMRLLKVKVPINYDPIAKTYTGPWNGKFKIAWTDNPAWCFYDLITNNRFGLGKYINADLADKWNLYEIGQYCDQLVNDGFGGLEPRFRCNVYIATKDEAYKVLNDMASIFLAITYYSAGQITLSQDSPKDPIYLFNNSNVIDGEFNYSDASKKSRKTVALVRYNDENDNYKPGIEYIEDRYSISKFGIRETEIAAFGCTSKNQARRVGKWLLTTQNTETEVVDFTAGLEGNFLKPGDIISIYDQYRKNSAYAGRTLELTTGYAILDLPYNYANTYPITGVNVNNSLIFNVLTPTYNLNPGTQLGDFYITGSNATSSGAAGLNSSFFRKSQLQSITISNPINYVTSGNGIYSNNIKINFPTNANIPENISAGMSKAGNLFTKTAATAAWDSQAYSSISYNKNIYVEAQASQTTAAIMFGFNADPLASASFDTLDYAWYFTIGGGLKIYESNAEIQGDYGDYTTSTKLRINYDGNFITYLKDNVVLRATPVKNQNEYFYFDASFYTVNGQIAANYGTFPLNNYLTTLPQNTVWSIDINTSGYLPAGVNTRSQMNNPLNTAYPGYYLEPYLNKPKKYRVLTVTEKDINSFAVNALEYNEQKYKDIDNIATLVNVPNRPPLPTTPILNLSGLFRNSAGYFYRNPYDPYVGHYTSNQGGINSVIYNIIPTQSTPSTANNLYYVYVNSGVNFGATTPETTLKDIISTSNLRTGITNYYNVDTFEYDPVFPPFFTPLYAGSYYFRVFAENTIGERSAPATGLYILSNQASVFSVIASGINVY
jgi:hypothetical protein